MQISWLRSLVTGGLVAVALAVACSSDSSDGEDGGAGDGTVQADLGRPDAEPDAALPPDGGVEDGSVDSSVDQAAPDSSGPKNTWVALGASPRLVEHTATLLDDGRVLIVGGLVKETDDGPVVALSKTYLYEPGTDQLTDAGELQEGRGRHTATRLDDGRVLIAGGAAAASSAAGLSSTEIFDPAKSGQAAWSPGPSMNLSRGSHEAVLLNDGSVLVAGGVGSGSQLSSAERYVPGQGWQIASSMSTKRAKPSATRLANGKVLVAGGYDGQSHLDTLEIFDPVTGGWADSAATLNGGRAHQRAVLADDGRAVLIGGLCGPSSSCDNDAIYDPGVDAIVDLPHPGNPPVFASATHLNDGRVLVIGGVGTAVAVTAFDPSAMTWTTLASMTDGRFSHTATLLDDGSVLVIGGQTGGVGTYGPYVETAERYYP